MTLLRDFLDLPNTVVLLIIVLFLCLVILLTYTILQWIKTPANQFKMLPKLIWLIVIIISQPLGPILFLTLGTKPESIEEQSVTQTITERDVVQEIYRQGEH